MSSEGASPAANNNLAATLTRELTRLEKRDWELWMIVGICGVVSAGIVICLLFPSAFLQDGEFRLEASISRRGFFVVITLLMLVNTYVLTRRAELRRVRRRSVTNTIESELVRLQSFTDPLTEVFNRRSLDEMAARFIGRAKRTQEPLTFLLVDVDDFKRVNTRFGHITGDFVLSEVAGLLRSSTRGSDAVVRYGGDEFVIILANTSPLNAGAVVKRISDYLGRWNEGLHLDDFPLTVSVGIAGWQDGETLDEVLDAADREMYACKHAKAAKSRA